MKEVVKKLIEGVLEAPVKFSVEYPADLAHGDFASNVAMVAAKTAGENPKAVAEKIKEKILADKPEWLAKVEVAGPGFINFYLATSVFAAEIKKVLSEKENYGRGQKLAGQKVIVEYTDPNPFKEFHIGHLMPNVIGESLSRLLAFSGAEVKRACYQGDVGLHVARAVWGLLELKPAQLSAATLGEAYAYGATKGDEAAIREINKKIYDKSDEAINKIYDEGRRVSLEYFETIYEKLGTKFDYYFFESAAGPFGKQVVEDNLGKVFEKSDGAVVFKGAEEEGLHTRVFINSDGLPTYEAKELGLAKIKFDEFPYDQSIVVTGNEIQAYFKVLLKAMSLVFPDLAAKTKHVAHGMLRLPTGKMSSRTGDVITAEFLLAEAMKAREDVTEPIAVAAIKYSILKQAPGRDIIFDLEKSLSFLGDSGPYLQYTAVRAQSILAKAPNLAVELVAEDATAVEKLLIRFPDLAAFAAQELAPNYIVTYLLELASAFNAYYAQNRIIGSENENYRLALTAAVAQVLKNGLGLLGIQTPDQM